MSTTDRRPSTGPRKDRRGALRGVAYVVGMAAVVLMGSAFVVGGLLARSTGWTAVLLAAVFPLAGFVFALTIAAFERSESQHRPVPGRRTPEPVTDPEADPDRDR